MKIALSKVVASVPALQELSKASVRGTIAFRISRNLIALEAVVKSFQEGKQTCILAFCDKDESGAPVVKDNTYTFTDPKMAAGFANEIEKLLAEEVELDLKTIKVSDIENAIVSASVFTLCSYLIEE